MIRKMNPLKLKPHPLNRRIYGHDKPDPDLVRSIQEHGVLEQLVILRDGTIISGHRRWRAALACEPVPKIPCQIVGYASKLDEQEALIEYNRQRRKTFSQLMNEANELERIYKAQSKTNQLSGLVQYKQTVKDEFQVKTEINENPDPVSEDPDPKETPEHVKAILKPTLSEKPEIKTEPVKKETKIIPKGKKVRDIVAKEVGMSGRTYQRAKKVRDAQNDKNPVVRKVACEEVEKLDQEKTSINAAHKRVRAAEKKGGRPKGSKVEGLPNGTVRKFVQTRLDTFETPVNQVSERAAQMVREHLESEAMGITIKAAKAAARENRKTINESDIRKALKKPLR